VILNAADVGKDPLIVLQGSKVEMTSVVDVPVGGAMLELRRMDDGFVEQVPMESAGAGRRFSTTFHVLSNMNIAALITMAGNQTVAHLPEKSLEIACTKDEKPTITINEPRPEMGKDTIALSTSTSELKIRASLKDDYGLVSAHLLTDDPNPRPGAAGEKAAAAMVEVHKESFPSGTRAKEFTFTLPFKPEQRRAGNTITVNLDVTTIAISAARRSRARPAALEREKMGTPISKGHRPPPPS